MKKIISIGAFILMFSVAALAQGNGFSFQGRLNDGTSPANGRYDLQFRLFDALTGGNQIGPLVSRPDSTLINGVFSVTLDFGATAFNSPNSIFIEIAIRPNGSPNAFTILGPRQQLTVVPFAVRAANATNADTASLATNAQHSIDAQIAVNATNANTAINSLSLGGFSAPEYPRLNVQNTGDLRTNGALSITGNAFQNTGAHGFVKAMVYVQQDGTILRCYNGVTNSSSQNCGWSVIHSTGGIYRVVFDFRVDDKFFSLTARNPLVASTWVAASFQLDTGNPNAIDVITFITNAGTNGGDAANFMLVVY